MGGVSSNDVSHPSSHGPSLDIENVFFGSRLLSFAPHLLMCHANEIR